MSNQPRAKIKEVYHLWWDLLRDFTSASPSVLPLPTVFLLITSMIFIVSLLISIPGPTHARLLAFANKGKIQALNRWSQNRSYLPSRQSAVHIPIYCRRMVRFTANVVGTRRGITSLSRRRLLASLFLFICWSE